MALEHASFWRRCFLRFGIAALALPVALSCALFAVLFGLAATAEKLAQRYDVLIRDTYRCF
jgi:hypothetical protein